MDGLERLSADVDLERRVPALYTLRAIRAAHAALSRLSGAFGRLYARLGQQSIPPKKLLRALLLAFYSIRSELQLLERFEFDVLFRCFVGLVIETPVWDASTFSKKRDRPLAGEVAALFLVTVVGRPEVKRLPSDDHFSVHGRLIKARVKPEELPLERRSGRAAADRAAQQPRLPRRAAARRDACLHARPRSSALPQVLRQGG